MEPVLGGRDDPAAAEPTRSGRSRRNGARPWRTGRQVLAAQIQQESGWPQWSPSLADGTTPQPSLRLDQHVRAAMEPVLGGRDDARRNRCASRAGNRRNGARPWRTGRPGPDLGRDSLLRCRNGARPWRTGRPTRKGKVSRAGMGRNGARPWRTGRRRATSARSRSGARPQWSPSLADGTTVHGTSMAPSGCVAAMEPVLGGRDDRQAEPANATLSLAAPPIR